MFPLGDYMLSTLFDGRYRVTGYEVYVFALGRKRRFESEAEARRYMDMLKRRTEEAGELTAALEQAAFDKINAANPPMPGTP